MWTIALYKLKAENEIFELGEHEPFHFFGERGIRQNVEYQATAADPFLFAHNDGLYLFYEIQTDFGLGEIWAQSMDAQGIWSNHGQVLKEDFHLSYPQVFFHDGQVWMIPETSASGKVWLYTAAVFPNKWRKTMVLVDEVLLDPSIIIQPEGIFLLGTTRENDLKLYFAPDLSQEFVSTDVVMPSHDFLARNAGRPLRIQNEIYRVAQNNQYGYGQGISLLQIDQLSINNYSEHVTTSDLFQTKPKWMESGCHHISTALFMNEHYVAVDGMRRDKFANTWLLAFLKVFESLKRWRFHYVRSNHK